MQQTGTLPAFESFFRGVERPLHGVTVANVGLDRDGAAAPSFGEVRDLGGPPLLLVSDAGRYMTGAAIVADGGQVVALRV